MPRSFGDGSFMVASEVQNGMYMCEILLDPEEKKLPFAGTPRLSMLLSLPGGEVEKHTLDFTWETPDRLKVQTPLPPGATVNAALEISGKAPMILPPALQSASAEFSRESEKDLAPLVLNTGGRVKSRFDDMSQYLPRMQEERSLVKEVLLGALLLLLFQVFCRRNGVEVSGEDMEEILNRLFIETTLCNGVLTCEIPSFRQDMTTDADIAEEVLRMYGYDHIPSTLMNAVTMPGYRDE
jgi:hypothetical protein